MGILRNKSRIEWVFLSENSTLLASSITEKWSTIKLSVSRVFPTHTQQRFPRFTMNLKSVGFHEKSVGLTSWHGIANERSFKNKRS